jgi:integrase
MPRRPLLEITLTTDKGFCVNVPKSLSADGKRHRHFYASEKRAKAHLKRLERAYHEMGVKGSVLDPVVESMAQRATEMLKGFDVTLLDVVREYVERHKTSGARLTLNEAWEAYKARLVADGKSESSVNDYARDLRSLPEWFKKTVVGTIDGSMMEKALDECTSKRGSSWNRKLRETKAVITEAMRTDAKQVRIDSKAPAIIKADTAQKLMEYADAHGCALPFALMLFAGIRPDKDAGEITRLSWENIHDDHIEISKEISKTESDRHIPISDNLRQWLDHCHGDDIIPTGWGRKYAAARAHAGISEEQDVLRHTFGSMFYRLHDETQTIQAMGHTSFKTFEKHYKKAVTRDEALAFFAIAPKSKAKTRTA